MTTTKEQKEIEIIEDQPVLINDSEQEKERGTFVPRITRSVKKVVSDEHQYIAITDFDESKIIEITKALTYDMMLIDIESDEILQNISMNDNCIRVTIKNDIIKIQTKAKSIDLNFYKEMSAEYDFKFGKEMKYLKKHKESFRFRLYYIEDRRLPVIVFTSTVHLNKFIMLIGSVLIGNEKFDPEIHLYAERQEPETWLEEWDYEESVKKVKQTIYKWKNLNDEILIELQTARKLLSYSPSEAATIMHKNAKPYMTWTNYCIDIGSSRQVVNRWLDRAFPKPQPAQTPDDTPQSAPNPEDCDTDEPTDTTQPQIDDKFYLSINLLIGKRKKRDPEKDFLMGYFLPRSELHQKVDTLTANANVKEYIALVRADYSNSDRFNKLLGNIVCYAKIDMNNYGFFTYKGENEDAFKNEFAKHGILFKKM